MSCLCSRNNPKHVIRKQPGKLRALGKRFSLSSLVVTVFNTNEKMIESECVCSIDLFGNCVIIYDNFKLVLVTRHIRHISHNRGFTVIRLYRPEIEIWRTFWRSNKNSCKRPLIVEISLPLSLTLLTPKLPESVDDIRISTRRSYVAKVYCCAVFVQCFTEIHR